MSISKMELGTIVTVILALIAGASAIGSLKTKVEVHEVWKNSYEDDLKSKKEKVLKKLDEKVSALGSIPKKAVVPFNLIECPGGWSEYTPARGRFVRGIDGGSTPIDPAGKRGPGNIQDDQLKQHSHRTYFTLNGWPKESGDRFANGPFYILHSSKSGSKGHINTTSDGSKHETRPMNVALLFCQKG